MPWRSWIDLRLGKDGLRSFKSFNLPPVLHCWAKLYGITRDQTAEGMKALVYNCIFNATLIVQFIGVDKRNKAQKKEWNHPVMDFFLQKKPIFNWKFSFQQPIVLRVKICLSLPSQLGLLRTIPSFFLLWFPRLRETEKKHHETASLTFKHKKRGAGEADGSSVGWKIRPFFWWAVFWLFLVGGREVKRVFGGFQDDTVIPGWVITTMGVEAWCFSQQT